MYKENINIPLLDKALSYKNPDVIDRFCKNYNVTRREANQIFLELLKFLWLCAVAKIERTQNKKNVPEKIAVDFNILIIDEMWHNFLCFTHDYEHFCLKVFGVFVHHFPTPKKRKNEILRKLRKDEVYLLSIRKKQYEYIYDKLGEKTLLKWYDTFPKKYTKERIKQLKG